MIEGGFGIAGGGGSWMPLADAGGVCGFAVATGGPTGLLGVEGTSSIEVNMLKFWFSLTPEFTLGVL